MSLVAAFLLFNMRKMHYVWTYNFLQEVRQHILGEAGNVIYKCFEENLTSFPAVK